MSEIEARFWPKVRITPACWEWQASLQTSGYGQLGKARPEVGIHLAHRLSYEIHFGPIPEGLVVRHRCDNKVCVNPDHLIPGTAKDNSRDAMERGLLAYGDRNPSTRLTPEQVEEVRALRGTAYQKEIAAMYGITQAHVSNIQIGKRRARVA